MEQLITLVLQLFMPVIAAAIVGMIWKYIGAEGMRKIESELSAKNEYVKIAVRLIEQAYKDLRGKEKADKALEWISARLKEKGINFTEDELRGMIESAVRYFKDEFGENWANARVRELAQKTQNEELAAVISKHGVRLSKHGVRFDGNVAVSDVNGLTPAIVEKMVQDLKKQQY